MRVGAAGWRPMDVVRIIGSALGCMKALFDILEKSNKRAGKLAVALESLQLDLAMIKGHFEEDEELHLQPKMELMLQELAYDIDDFVHGLCIPGEFGGFVLSATGRDIRDVHIDRIKLLQTRVEAVENKLEKFSQATKSSGSATAVACPERLSSAGSTGVPCAAEKEDLVGIAKPKQEIADLLSPPDGPLRVISIVGCSGLGKTALAGALYNDKAVTDEFDCYSWVTASNDSSDGILKKILTEAGLRPASGSPSKALQHFPKNKRYLFFIDNVQQKGIVWKDIKKVFRENNMGSRIILTTRAHSVAAACSRGSYMYPMKFLGEEESEKLFWTKATDCQEAPAKLAKSPEGIFLKCGGLPLALISAGEYLSVKGMALDRCHCDTVGRGLGGYLVGEEKEFEEMKRALVQCYDNLPDYDHRNCLLYFSIFPRGHQISSKSLFRKLTAEEFVAEDEDVRRCLEELIDQSMIEEVQFRNDPMVVTERCKAHSIMLEFTIKKAVSRNFMSLLQEGNLQCSDSGSVRRLTIQSRHKIKKELQFPCLRSLTIFGNGILDFRSSKMMRVLDLEGCSWIDKTYADAICELVFLKYLSLRNTCITTLPKEVCKLLWLETLDIRDTKVNKLPVQVISLPQLAFLFGKFELPHLAPKGKNTKMLEKFLQEKSKLKTLGRIVINGTQDFVTLILHARMLEKVKIWFKVDSPEDINSGLAAILVSSLQKRFEKDENLGYSKLEAISIDFNGLRYNFLGSVQALCTITSIKLWRNLADLPRSGTLSQLTNLTKLHLFSTGLSIEALVVLQKLEYLVYLKLVEDHDGSWDGEFLIKDGGFSSLHFLCLQAPKLPKVTFEQGSMVSLRSLHFLCPGSPVEVEGLTHLASLNEVILHHCAGDKIVEAWKDAAKKNINRPHLKKQTKPFPFLCQIPNGIRPFFH